MSLSVYRVKKHECYDWLLNKHYAKRIPSITECFGLYYNNVLNGVITFGMPPSSTLAESVCGQKYAAHVIELNRLVINDNLPKNALSYFVSESIKNLKGDKIIVSFADANMNHNGYIYQACNFLYTGTSSNTSKLIDKNGVEFHFRNIGHYQKNNKVNAKLIKRRINEENIDRIEVAQYLRSYKGNLTASKIDAHFGYKDTAAHWFRLDSGFSFPNVEDWIELKKLLNFDNTFDEVMTDFEWIPCAQDIVKKLQLTKVDILPKHRYVIFKGSKKFKRECRRNLKYNLLPYPKGMNKNYQANYQPQVQGILF